MRRRAATPTTAVTMCITINVAFMSPGASGMVGGEISESSVTTVAMAMKMRRGVLVNWASRVRTTPPRMIGIAVAKMTAASPIACLPRYPDALA